MFGRVRSTLSARLFMGLGMSVFVSVYVVCWGLTVYFHSTRRSASAQPTYCSSTSTVSGGSTGADAQRNIVRPAWRVCVLMSRTVVPNAVNTDADVLATHDA